MKLTAAILLGAACVTSPAFAGDIMILGVGQRSCGQFLAAGGEAPIGTVLQKGQYYGEQIRFNEWMMGFVSGFNAAYEGDVTSQIRVDLASLDVWLRKWCNENPTKAISQAAVAFRDQMTHQR